MKKAEEGPVAGSAEHRCVCGSLLALDVLGWGVRGLFAFVALGIVSFALVIAFSTTRRAWTGRA